MPIPYAMIMSEPENEYQNALKVLNRYYTVLAEKIAGEIIEHREDFESPGYGSRAEEIIDRHARIIQELGFVYGILRWKAYPKKPEGKEPLGKTDFRCFRCGGLIRSNEEACLKCGWKWK